VKIVGPTNTLIAIRDLICLKDQIRTQGDDDSTTCDFELTIDKNLKDQKDR